jgi:hypothetical protein
MAYATADQTYQLALTARAFVVAPSPIQAVDPSTGTIRLTAHGYGAADQILFHVTSGGLLTPELSTFVYYSPIVLGADLFRVAHPITGLPIIFTETSRGWAVGVDPSRRLTLHLADAAARIDQHLTAHSTPILVDPVTGLYPPVLVGLNARMGARSAVTSLQVENPAFREPMDRLFAMAASDGDTNPPAQPGSLLGDWKAGISILPTPVDQNDVADMGPRARARGRYGASSSACGCGPSVPWERRSL